MAAVRVGIQDAPLAVQPLIDWAKDPRAGAIVSFTGLTRDSFDGRAVRSLTYDAYIPRAEKTLARIAEAASEREGVAKVCLVHRIGTVPISEESVVIVVAGAHRAEAWAVAEWILEELKRTVEIWKKEVYMDGSSQWIVGTQRVMDEPRLEAYAA